VLLLDGVLFDEDEDEVDEAGDECKLMRLLL
jgi:hypothetical protein